MAAVAVVGLGATSAAADAAPGDIGTEGFSYAPVTGSPTQTKPESKLWFNDGAWWASMYSPTAGVHRIHRLDTATDRWIDTGTTLDPRNNANADVLWHAASRKLYVASHVFTQSGTAAAAGQAGRLYRYSYEPATGRHTLDAGFPVLVNGARTESLVIDMDSTGRLWATWVQDAQIYVNHTNGDHAAWGTPYIVSRFFGTVSDDLSALVAFGGDRIGVMFSRQFFGDQRFFYFAVHRDGAGDAPGDWSLAPIQGAPATNDHINLKADRAGRVFAAVKSAESDPASPRTMLLRRDADSTWSSATFGTVADGHTRPIMVLEDPGSRAHMFATCPQPPAVNGDAGGDICEKTTSVDALGFEPGIGTAVIRDAGSPELNDVTSTKQPVNAATGLVILANNPAPGIDTYWHRSLRVSTPAPPPVAASFAAAPTPEDPLTASFLDTSSGGATSWLWQFGDGTTSTAPPGAPLRAAGRLRGQPDRGERHEQEHHDGDAAGPRAVAAGLERAGRRRPAERGAAPAGAHGRREDDRPAAGDDHAASAVPARRAGAALRRGQPTVDGRPGGAAAANGRAPVVDGAQRAAPSARRRPVAHRLRGPASLAVGRLPRGRPRGPRAGAVGQRGADGQAQTLMDGATGRRAGRGRRRRARVRHESEAESRRGALVESRGQSATDSLANERRGGGPSRDSWIRLPMAAGRRTMGE